MLVIWYIGYRLLGTTYSFESYLLGLLAMGAFTFIQNAKP